MLLVVFFLIELSPFEIRFKNGERPANVMTVQKKTFNESC